MIWRLLDESWLSVDLEGAPGVEMAMAPDLGVLGEDFMAMAVISGGFCEKMKKGELGFGVNLRVEPSGLNQLS